MRWPWPQDSREDKARRVAQSYRRLAQGLPEQHLVDALDHHWIDLGQSWVVPTQSTINPDDWVTADEAAELFSIPAKSVYDWGRRGHVRKVHSRYNVGDIIRYSQTRGKRTST